MQRGSRRGRRLLFPLRREFGTGASPSVSIHARLVSLEKMSLRTAIGVGIALLLIGWLLLQTYHFGKGGFLGELRTQTPSVALDQTRLHTLS